MVRLLLRKTLRDLRGSLGTYVVCIFIIAVGLMGYSVLSLAGEQLDRARDRFFENTRACDLFAEVYEAPLSASRALEQIPGVQRAQGRILQTVRLDTDEGNPPELLLISFTEDGLNIPYLTSGTLPAPGETNILVGDGFFNAHHLQAGDTLSLRIKGQAENLTVTGSGISPETVYMIKNMFEMLPDPMRYDAAFLPYETMERLFAMSGRCNGFVLTLAEGYTLEQVEDAVKKTLAPYGCYSVYDIADHISSAMLNTEIKQIGNMSKVIPLLFLLICSVVLYISLRRMVERQRTQIGTLMALGLSGRGITLHYTVYGGVIGLIGGLLGGVFGTLAAAPMADFYRTYFTLPDAPFQPSLFYLFSGILMSTVFCCVVSGFPAWSAGKLAPAEAMRPAAPKSAQRSLLERIPLLTKTLTVSGLMALRSLGRSRAKSVLSLLGIACAYMITATLVSMSSLFDVFLFDYLEQSQRQDITVAFTAPVRKDDALRALRNEEVILAEGVLETPVLLRGVSAEKDCTVQGIEPDSALCLLYDEAGRPVRAAGDGVILSRHMADLIGVGAGGTVELKFSYPQEKTVRLRVDGIIAQYMGSICYMDIDLLGRLSGLSGAVSSVLLKAPLSLQSYYLDELSDGEQVAGVKNRTQIIDQYRGMMGNVTSIMFSMAAMGVLISVAVIYVTALIGFEEQKREISTMMMLGLNSRQCLEVISVGQWLLTLGSFFIGIPLTYLANFLLSRSLAGDLFTIPMIVSPTSLLLGVGLTFLAVYLSTRAIHRKLKRLQPVDLMRERE